MANVLYHKRADGSYMNINAPGGPNIFKVQFLFLDIAPAGAFYPTFTYDGGTIWEVVGNGVATVAQAQTALDNFMASYNAGTIT